MYEWRGTEMADVAIARCAAYADVEEALLQALEPMGGDRKSVV